jgi:hypothetical protein
MNKSVIQNAIEQRDPTLARDALREIDLLLGSTPDPNERIYLLFSKHPVTEYSAISKKPDSSSLWRYNRNPKIPIFG